MFTHIAAELKENLLKAVQENPVQGLLLSGGLDSSILAFLNPNIKAITISLKSYGEDAKYSKKVAEFLNLKYYHSEIDIEEAIESIPEVIKILNCFDPAIPNDLCVYFGLRKAKQIGIKKLMTGDGSDELFGGYSFMQDIDMLNSYIKRIIPFIQFSSSIIGRSFNIKVYQPYLNREIIDFALNINSTIKIRQESDKIFGKWILRKAFEKSLPEEIIWQDKRALEYGSGMNILREIISSRVNRAEFEREEKMGKIKFINREHYFYYKIYMDIFEKIPTPKRDEKECPSCGAGMEKQAFHCRICGNVLCTS